MNRIYLVFEGWATVFTLLESPDPVVPGTMSQEGMSLALITFCRYIQWSSKVYLTILFYTQETGGQGTENLGNLNFVGMFLSCFLTFTAAMDLSTFTEILRAVCIQDNRSPQEVCGGRSEVGWSRKGNSKASSDCYECRGAADSSREITLAKVSAQPGYPITASHKPKYIGRRQTEYIQSLPPITTRRASSHFRIWAA